MNINAILVGHTEAVSAVRWTRDGHYCMSASEDRTVRLWNPHKTFTSDSGAAGSTGNRQVSLPDATLEPKTFGLHVKTYSGTHGYGINDVAIFHDSSRFVSAGGDRSLFVHDVTSGTVLRKLNEAHTQAVNAVALNASSTVLMSASYDQSVRLWDLRSQSRAHGQHGAIQILRDFKDSVTSVDCSGTDSVTDDGGVYISASCVDGVQRTYDLRMGLLHEDNHGEPIIHSRPLGAVRGLGRLRASICMAGPKTGSSGGIYLTSASASHKGGAVLGTARTTAVSITGKSEQSGGDGNMCLRTYLGSQHRAYKTECDALHCEEGRRSSHAGVGSVLIAGGDDGNICMWDLVSGELRTSYPFPPDSHSAQALPGVMRSNHVCSVKAHPEKALVLTSNHSGGIALWDVISSSKASQRREEEGTARRG